MVDNHQHDETGNVIVVEEVSPEEAAAEAAVAIAQIEAEKEIALAEIYAGQTEVQAEAEVTETAMEVEAEFNAQAEVAALRDELRMALDEMRAEREAAASTAVVIATEGSESAEVTEPVHQEHKPKKSNPWW